MHVVKAENDENVKSIIENLSKDFDKSLEGDLNTHLALLAFYQLVKETNKLAADGILGKKIHKS